MLTHLTSAYTKIQEFSQEIMFVVSQLAGDLAFMYSEKPYNKNQNKVYLI